VRRPAAAWSDLAVYAGQVDLEHPRRGVPAARARPAVTRNFPDAELFSAPRSHYECMEPYKHTPEELEMIERNLRADAIMAKELEEGTFPPHDMEDAKWGECGCRSCLQDQLRDPG